MRLNERIIFSEELCTVEDDEEFMVVRSRTALVTEKIGQMSSDNSNLKDKMKELEDKHRLIRHLVPNLTTRWHLPKIQLILFCFFKVMCLRKL